MVSIAPKERQETLRISKKLNKFITLPSFLNWKVHESDVLHRGRILCMMRAKRIFLPDDVSDLKMRVVTVTKQGFMVLYEKVDEGLIVDLRSASHVLTECDKYKTKKMKYSRSHIKIRLPRGNVHLFVRDEQIPKWTAAILAAHVTTRQKPLIRPVVNRQSIVEPTTAIEPMVHETSPSSPTTSSNSGMITVVEKSSDGSVVQSVRHGHVSVDSLRRQLENSFTVRENPKIGQKRLEHQAMQTKEPKFITSLFVLHEGLPAVDERKEEEDKVKESSEGKKKEWWMRSLRC